MKLNTENPTTSELVAWGNYIFEERVTVKGLALSQGARDEFLAFIMGPAEKAAAHPRYLRRYWQNIHRLVRDVGSLSASSAEWSRRAEVVASDVEAALKAYQHIKSFGTILCPWDREAVEGTLETAAVA